MSISSASGNREVNELKSMEIGWLIGYKGGRGWEKIRFYVGKSGEGRECIERKRQR